MWSFLPSAWSLPGSAFFPETEHFQDFISYICILYIHISNYYSLKSNIYFSFWNTALQVTQVTLLWLWGVDRRPPIHQVRIQTLKEREENLVFCVFFWKWKTNKFKSTVAHMQIIDFTLFSVLRRVFQAHSCLLCLFSRDADRAGDLSGAGDEKPAVDWQETRGGFAVLEAFWGQNLLVIGPAQTGLWVPACRLAAHVHHVIFFPHCWQKRCSSNF